ncbi:MAG: hypothetical protein ACLP8S_02560 [Solirubrobacteraceae bacterium]
MAASAAAAKPYGTVLDASGNYTFKTLDNSSDLTFNQLLGINGSGLIAGYYGSGMKGHPNRGYLLSNDGSGSYTNENFPGAAQTQVTGLNNVGITVGFWASQKGANFGFYSTGRHLFHIADYPTSKPASPPVDQLLGVNDSDIAVGFYNDSGNNAHGYTYDIVKHRYAKVNIAGATSVTATAINNGDDIAGFETTSSSAMLGFVQLRGGKVLTLSVPGASQTQAFGINDGDVVVGTYTVGTGNNVTTHGFIWAPGFGYGTVDDPNGVGTTTLNGINDHGRLVGFYTDPSGNTHGLLATPAGL